VTVRARSCYRDDDGRLRPVDATGPTRKATERRLEEKIARRGTYSTGHGELTADTPFSTLVDVWLEDLELEGRIGESTRELHERDMRILVLPAFEHFTLREIAISKVDRFLKAQAKISYSRAKHSKVVLNLALGLSLRYEAISRNPVLGTSRLPAAVNGTRADRSGGGGDPARRQDLAAWGRAVRAEARRPARGDH
jgi:hypothetical protein